MTEPAKNWAAWEMSGVLANPTLSPDNSRVAVDIAD